MIRILGKFILYLLMQENTSVGWGLKVPPSLMKDLNALVVWHSRIGSSCLLSIVLCFKDGIGLRNKFSMVRLLLLKLFMKEERKASKLA